MSVMPVLEGPAQCRLEIGAYSSDNAHVIYSIMKRLKFNHRFIFEVMELELDW